MFRFRDKCSREITLCRDKIRTLVKQKSNLETRCKELEEKALRVSTASRRNVTVLQTFFYKTKEQTFFYVLVMVCD